MSIDTKSVYEIAVQRGLTYHIYTYGCQMNVHDSQKLAGILQEMGFREGKGEHADFILFNTCCVREHAESKLNSNVGVLRKRKEENPALIVGVCGCMMQQEDVAQKFARSFPFVDIIFGTHSMHKLGEMLYRVLVLGERSLVVDAEDAAIEDIPVYRNTPPLSYVSIMQGCDNFCSYCIVPYVRGRERSRAPQAILREVCDLAKAGYKEVMLLGQNVNSYGKGIGTSFPQLLKEIAEQSNMQRIRFMTSHPKDVSGDLIAVMRDHDTICKSLHLPLQSGSTDVLQRMNRKYTKEQYLDLVKDLRTQMPNIALTTDIIVGFPGETQGDFAQTMQMMEQVHFDAAYMFVYSPRKGTRAATFADQVPRDVKQKRIMQLVDLQAELTFASNKRYVGNVERVLVEGSSKRGTGESCGRTDSGKMVNFPGEAPVGAFVDVEITQAKRTTLFGKLV